jgi:RNA polymerase sigma-70 factor, ECF subfamily
VIDAILEEEVVSSTPNEVFANPQMDFGGVASRYSPMLFRIALRRLRNVEDAEDAVQDTLLSAYKHIGNFEGRARLSTWLTRIVINVAGMKLRSRARREIVSLDQTPGDGEPSVASGLVDARPNPEAICAQAEMEETLRTALAHISPKLRVAFEMREMAGLSTREITDTLRIKTTALKSRLKRARTALSLYLDRTNRVRPAEELTISSRNRAAGLVQARKCRQAQRKIARTQAQPNLPRCEKLADGAAVRTFEIDTNERSAAVEFMGPIVSAPLFQSDLHAQNL